MRTMTPAPERHTPGGPLRAKGDGRGLFRVGLHLLLAALPLLAISAHVFGLIRMQVSAAVLVIPLATAVVALTVLAPHAGDRVLAHGMIWGILACALYDAFRLETVYMLGWWGDFIPTMGTWITGNPADKVSGAVVGYLWRYIGDGGGIGIAFFAVASTFGLHLRSRRTTVVVAVGFAVFPVWAGLIGTVALASNGQNMMFPLTPTTLTLSLIGHLIFGLILGLGFWCSRAVQEDWPWEPITGELRALVARADVAAPSRHGSTLSRHDPAPSRHEDTPSRHGAVPSLEPAASRHEPASSRHEAVPSLEPAASRHGPGSSPHEPASSRHHSAPRGMAVAVAGAAPAGGAPSGALPIQRLPDTPPGGQTLDPDTWELWQRQLRSTARGRRTHGARTR